MLRWKIDLKFIGVLFNASIIGLIFPDFDYLIKKFIGHRSILTHSILVPYLFYYYYVKKKHKPNRGTVTLIIGLFLGLALHLTEDIYPQNGSENELIKLTSFIKEIVS